MSDDVIAFVDSVHQRSAHGHIHLRSTGECLDRAMGERCPTWEERTVGLQSRVDAALGLHRPSPSPSNNPWCLADGRAYPCPTVTALTGTPQ